MKINSKGGEMNFNFSRDLMSQKRGVSGVVTAVLLILLVIAAVGIGAIALGGGGSKDSPPPPPPTRSPTASSRRSGWRGTSAGPSCPECCGPCRRRSAPMRPCEPRSRRGSRGFAAPPCSGSSRPGSSSRCCRCGPRGRARTRARRASRSWSRAGWSRCWPTG